MMSDNADNPADSEAGKHAQARFLTEKALREEAAGNQEEADRLFSEAERTDPSAVEAVLRETGGHGAPEDAPGNDEEIARVSREIKPRSAAPDRAGITDSGSGADSERR
jgi:hypothetical protein